MSLLATDLTQRQFPEKHTASFLHGVLIEFYCLRCGKMLWLMLLLPTVLVVLQLAITKLLAVANALEQNDLPAANANAYGFMTDGLLLGFKIVNLMLIGFCAHSFSSERDVGSLKHIVIRGISRIRLLLSKYTVIVFIGFASLAVMMSVVWLVSGALWNFGPVIEEGFELIGTAEIHAELRRGIILALLPLPASIAFALVVSVVAKNATQAVALALGITLSLDLLKTTLGNLAFWYYGFYQPALVDHSYLSEVAKIVRGFSDVLVNESQILFNYTLPLVQVVVLLIIAVILVRRRTL